MAYAEMYLHNLVIFIECWLFNEMWDYFFPPRQWKINIVLALFVTAIGDLLT